MSRIRRILTVFTSLGLPANYTLQATVPPHTLSRCSAALPRPNWEPVLYYSIVCAMGFLLCCILVAAYFEADRIFVSDIIRRRIRISNTSSQTYDKNKVFDLNKVAGIHGNTSPALKFPIPSDRPITAKQVLELPNGHAEHNQQKSSEPFFSTLLSIAKNFLSSKSSNSNKSKSVSKNSELDTSLAPPSGDQRGRHTDKDKRQITNQEIVPEKSSTTNQRSRKSKAAKRQHNDAYENSHSNHDKNQGNSSKDITSQDSRNHDRYKSGHKNNITMTTTETHGVSGIDDITIDNQLATEGKLSFNLRLFSSPSF